MPAPQTPSYYGPGSSVGDNTEYRQDSHHQPQNVGWKDPQQHHQFQHPQAQNIPASPPPSYAGHGYEYGNGGVPGGQAQVQGQGIGGGQQHLQEPLQVYAHHAPDTYQHGPNGVYEQNGQNGGWYAPSPSPGPLKHNNDRKDRKERREHGGVSGGGNGKYPRPGGDVPVEVVYVDRQQKKKGHDGFAWGCCAGCTAACCCCGCVVM